MDGARTSDLLKAMRLKRGLTQGVLARRAGTSVPTVSRYESGWSRFELYTLQKLATALNCRLQIQLEPIQEDSHRLTPGAVKRRLQRLFWDRRLKASDLNDYPDWVIRRVLEYGALEDVRALLGSLGKETLFARLAAMRFDSARARIFWQEMLEMEGILCTRRSSREEASSSWRE